jgi:hypothetical protein
MLRLKNSLCSSGIKPRSFYHTHYIDCTTPAGFLHLLLYITLLHITSHPHTLSPCVIKLPQQHFTQNQRRSFLYPTAIPCRWLPILYLLRRSQAPSTYVLPLRYMATTRTAKQTRHSYASVFPIQKSTAASIPLIEAINYRPVNVIFVGYFVTCSKDQLVVFLLFVLVKRHEHANPVFCCSKLSTLITHYQHIV